MPNGFHLENIVKIKDILPLFLSMFKYIMTNTIFSNLPNDIIMNIIKIETTRATEEKERKRREEEEKRIHRLGYHFCVFQFTEIMNLIEDDYDRGDIDRWGFEKISLDFWHNVEISNCDYSDTYHWFNDTDEEEP